jgi:hypothetical protein
MSASDKETKKADRAAQIGVWMVTKSSRNKSLSDKLCRFLVNRSTAVKPEDDFMRDPLIDNDRGFDPDELERFQRGEAD